MRALSKTVFGGAQYRVEIGATIAERGDFNAFDAGELSEKTGISKQSISHELRMLEEAGLIERVPPAKDSPRKVFYTRTASAYWAWCQEAAKDAVEMLRRKAPY
jgi:DNA-binding MarR family transcriptional regulator